MGLIMHCGVPYSGGLDNAIVELDRTERTALNTNFELSDSIQNYDLVLFQAYYTSSNVYIGSGLWKTADLLDTNRVNEFWIAGGDVDRSIKIKMVDDTRYQILSSKSCGIFGVYGLKIGTGEVKRFTNLWNYVDDNSGSVLFGTFTKTLKDTIDNYDDILIEFMSNSSDSGDWDATNQFRLNVEELSKAKNPYRFSFTSFDTRSSSFYLRGTTFQKIKDNEKNINGLVNVYGIKYGYGGMSGSNVVANPPGNATSTLHKLKVGNEIYNIEGGGSGGTGVPIKTVLYNTSTTTTNIEIVLNDDISNYDELEFVTGFTSNDLSESYYRCTVSDFKAKYPYTGSTALTNPQLIVSLYGSNYMCFQCGSTDDRIYIVRSSNSRLVAINGIKYADNSKCLYWDFTKSSLDMNFFSPANLSNATIGSSGAVMTNNTGYIEFQNFLLRKNMSYEIQIESMNITDTSRQNNIFRFKNLSSNNEAGFLYRYQTLKWVVWDSVNSWQESEITDKDYFNNCTMKIKTLSDGKWEIYKDNVLVFTTPLPVTFEGTASWGIGSPADNRSVTGMTISSVKIYHND